MQRMKEADEVDAPAQRPYLLYVTSSDAKLATKIKSWEESRLAEDKIFVATKPFDCYMLDETTLGEDHPLRETLCKNLAPSFVVFHQGELLYGSGTKPSSSKIYSVLKKSVSKVYDVSLDRVIKDGLDIKKKLDKIQEAKKELDSKLAALDGNNDRKKEKYSKQKEELESEEKTLLEQEGKLFTLTVKNSG